MPGKYANHYCPVCLAPVNENSGDHWHYCEYEPNENGPYGMPLTERQMLERRLAETKERAKQARADARNYAKRIKALELEIEQKSETTMQKSTETVDCNGTQVDAWFIEDNIRWTFDRPAITEPGGGVRLSQLRDDECVRAPGAIYRRAPHM